MDRWIRTSVAVSTAEVASSRRSNLGRDRMARARQRSCFWPWERLDPDAEMGEAKLRNTLVFSFTPDSLPTAVVVPDSVVEDSGTGVLSVEGIRCTRCSASLS